MTRDERRQAWRAYMTAMLSAADFSNATMDALADVADTMLKTEQQRFDAPDHAGNGVEIVETPAWVSAQFRPLDLSVTAPFVNTGQPPEPRPWVDLTEAEITQIVATFYSTQADRVRHTQYLLREKNGGMR